MSRYEIIQFHDSVDSTTLQFPVVPLEAIVESVDARSTPIGIPASVTSLSYMTSTAVAPTSSGQKYYNTSDHKIYTAVSSGAAYVWNAGEEPAAGTLYRGKISGATSDTLYIKSVDYEGAVKLSQLQLVTVDALQQLTDSLQEYVRNYVASISVYGHIPSILYAAPVISGNPPTTQPVNQSVTLTASYSPYVQVKQYSTNNGATWLNYPESGVVCTSNCTRWFRGVDSQGDMTSTGSYDVTNFVSDFAIQMTATPSSATNQNVSVAIQFDSRSTVNEYKVGNNNWTTVASGSSAAVVTLADNNTVYARQTNSSGLYAESSKAVTWIDLTAPSLSYDLYPAGWTNGNVTVVLHYADTAATRQYSTDNGSTWSNYTTETSSGNQYHASVTMTSNGTLIAKGANALNNTRSATVVVSSIDTTAPVVSSVYLADPSTLAPVSSGAYVTSGVVRTSAVYDGAPIASYVWKKDGDPTVSTGWASTTVATYPASANGTYYVKVYDRAGNVTPVASCTVSQISNADTTPPDIRLWGYDSSSELAETYCSASAYNEPDLQIYWQYKETSDGSYGASSSYNPSLPLVKNGYYRYFATDSAGNTGEAVLTLTNLVSDEERD